jgi:hypothetical protein
MHRALSKPPEECGWKRGGNPSTCHPDPEITLELTRKAPLMEAKGVQASPKGSLAGPPD